MKKVAVIMGSDSDLPVVGKAIDKLGDFGVPVEVHVMSAHRTPEAAAAFSASAADKGFGVIITPVPQDKSGGFHKNPSPGILKVLLSILNHKTS